MGHVCTHAPKRLHTVSSAQTPFGTDARDGGLPTISDKDRARIEKLRAKEVAQQRAAFEVGGCQGGALPSCWGAIALLGCHHPAIILPSSCWAATILLGCCGMAGCAAQKRVFLVVRQKSKKGEGVLRA